MFENTIYGPRCTVNQFKLWKIWPYYQDLVGQDLHLEDCNERVNAAKKRALNVKIHKHEKKCILENIGGDGDKGEKD